MSPVLRRALALLALAAVALLGVAPSAGAHNVLESSDPADGASLATAPAAVRLTFNADVQPGFSTVTVTGPDGAQWQDGAAVDAGPTVSVPLRPLGQAGEYTIGYQVLSADSHPVRGALRFTLTAPGPAAAPAPAAPSPAPSGTPVTPPSEPSAESTVPSPVPAAASSPADEGTPVWPWIVAAGVLVGAGVVVARRVGRAS